MCLFCFQIAVPCDLTFEFYDASFTNRSSRKATLEMYDEMNDGGAYVCDLTPEYNFTKTGGCTKDCDRSGSEKACSMVERTVFPMKLLNILGQLVNISEEDTVETKAVVCTPGYVRFQGLRNDCSNQRQLNSRREL